MTLRDGRWTMLHDVRAVAVTTEDEALAWITDALDKADFSKEADCYRLVEKFELELEPIVAAWDEKRVEVALTPLEVVVLEPEAKDAEVEERPSASTVKDAAASKRRPVPPDESLFISPSIQPSVEDEPKSQPKNEEEIGPSASKPEANAEEAYVEDDKNQANDIRRRIWRIAEALEWIKPDMMEKVGAVLWRLSEHDREMGCTVWVKWLRKHGVDDATA